MSNQPKKKRGRPGGPTPELREKICMVIRVGNFRDVASEWAGVKLRTFRRWCRLGRKATRGPYRDFWHAVLEAEKSAEILCVKYVMDGAKRDPKHAEWWLERKYPERWARQYSAELKAIVNEIKALRAEVEARKTVDPAPEDSRETRSREAVSGGAPSGVDAVSGAPGPGL